MDGQGGVEGALGVARKRHTPVHVALVVGILGDGRKDGGVVYGGRLERARERWGRFLERV